MGPLDVFVGAHHLTKRRDGGSPKRLRSENARHIYFPRRRRDRPIAWQDRPGTMQTAAHTAPPPPPRLVSEKAAAQILALSTRTLQRMRAEPGADGPPVIRTSARRIAYSVDDLNTWLAGRRGAVA